MSKVEARFDTKIALAVANAHSKKAMLKQQKQIMANVNQ